MNTPLKLYSYFRSSSAYRVRIALHLKAASFTTIPIHLIKNGGEQYAEEYRKLNPSAQVPSLVDGPYIIGQSMAILEYLEETFPNPPLLPPLTFERAIVRQMCEIINSGIQPLQNLSVTQSLLLQLGVSEEKKNAWVQNWILLGFESLESLLEKHSKQYCFGNQITFADCLLVPQVFSAKRFKVDLSAFPRALEINDRCLKLTDFVRASPERQPDYEP